MKYIPYLILLLSLNLKITAQDNFERFSLNFGLIHPIFRDHGNINWEYAIDPEIEVLMNFKVFDNSKISTGLGIQYGEHSQIQEISKLVMVDGIGLTPWQYTYHWKFSFLSSKIPLFIMAPLNNSFIDHYLTGISLGWLWNYSLTEQNIINPPNIKINRSYLDFSFGVTKNLSQLDKKSVFLTPILGYRMYLNDHNDWQKNHIFYQLKFICNL